MIYLAAELCIKGGNLCKLSLKYQFLVFELFSSPQMLPQSHLYAGG